MTTTEIILNHIDNMYHNLRSVDCSHLSTDDCKMLRLYIAMDYASYMFGHMYGFFSYENQIYEFTWHIHEPKQKYAHLSNQMTNIEQIVLKHDLKYDFDYITKLSPKSGHMAFHLYTPDSSLTGFDLSLRKLMKSIKAWSVREQLCKQIRRFDNKHLKWRIEQEKHHS